MEVPKIIFIVPYRNRQEHMFFFTNYIKYIMEDYAENEWEVYFAHQKDTREFNRGAMKNIGFLAMRDKYPEHYKDITFVFNDVDTIPYKKNLVNFETTNGKVKHFYGFTQALGGIISFKGCDFERVNGFPNYWGWGFEDNALSQRVLSNPELHIDRSTFFKIGDPKIVQSFDSTTRRISLANKKNFINDNRHDGLTTITNLNYAINTDTSIIDISSFDVIHKEDKSTMHDVNLLSFMKDGGGPDNRRNMFSMMRNSQQQRPPPQPRQPPQPPQPNNTLRRRPNNNNVTFRMF